jgi:hypothetical protein
MISQRHARHNQFFFFIDTRHNHLIPYVRENNSTAVRVNPIFWIVVLLHPYIYIYIYIYMHVDTLFITYLEPEGSWGQWFLQEAVNGMVFTGSSCMCMCWKIKVVAGLFVAYVYERALEYFDVEACSCA